MSPLLSIIVTTHNFELYLKSCLDSLLAAIPQQTLLPHYQGVEIIVVDDGSTDRTPHLLAEFASQPNIKIIRTTRQGTSHARNIGLKAVTGKYLTFLDGNDYWCEKLKWRDIERALESEADIIEFSYHCVDSDGQPLTTVHHQEVQLDKRVEIIPERLISRIKQFNWHLWCRIYKNELWQGVTFSVDKDYADIQILPKVYQAARTSYTTRTPLLCDRQSVKSLPATSTLSQVYELLDHANIFSKESTHLEDVGAIMARGLYSEATRMASRLSCEDYKTLSEQDRIRFLQLRGSLRKLLCIKDMPFIRYYFFPFFMMQNLRRSKERHSGLRPSVPLALVEKIRLKRVLRKKVA